MGDERSTKDGLSPRRGGERRLGLAGALFLGALLIAALGLWVRHGEEIFFTRIVTAIQSCL
jgi:hypothetical protein